MERAGEADREIAVECALGGTRAAVFEGGALVELHEERDGEQEQTEGLYLGCVQAVRPSVCAAFVDIGLARNAFLPLREGAVYRPGEMLIVQGAAGQSVTSKGMRVTDRPTLAGERLVLLPGEAGVRVSAKISDEALRARLIERAGAACPAGCGLIVRTAAADEAPLMEEAQALAARWSRALEMAKGRAAPGLLLDREPLALRLARDLGGSRLARVTVNDEALLSLLRERQSAGGISAGTRIELYDEAAHGLALFDLLGVERGIEQALARRVPLPCGGEIVFDAAEAMTVIDVNSARMVKGRDEEETALRVDLEAAREIARQLRLRGIGGVVVIDMIDLAAPERREQVLSCLREATANDRAGVTVEGMTRLGLVELTRRRVEPPLSSRLCAPCGRCRGAGAVLSAREIALRALREVRRMALSGQRGPFLVSCGAKTARELATLPSPARDADVYALCDARAGEPYIIEQLGQGMPPPQGAARLAPPKGA